MVRCPICDAMWGVRTVERCVCGYDHTAEGVRAGLRRFRAARTAGVVQLIVGIGLLAAVPLIISAAAGTWVVVAAFGTPVVFSVGVAAIVRGAVRASKATRSLRAVRAMSRLPVARVRS